MTGVLLQVSEGKTDEGATAGREHTAYRTHHSGQPPTLSFEQTIPRYLVHRAAVSEVFVTDMNVVAEGRYQVGAQWPRRHNFFGPRTKQSHDPMLYLETCRQAVLLVAHRAYGVPLNSNFVSRAKNFSIEAAGLATEGRPVDIVLDIATSNVRQRGQGVGGMRFDFDCYRDGSHIGSASEGWRCVSPSVYRRIRGDHFAATPFQATTLPTVDPALVGRDRAEDVLLAETSLHNVWSLQFDPDHPVLFDHPVDHVPGMVMIEGARQAALLMVGEPRALPVRADFDFDTYVEFDEPCLVIADEDQDAPEGTRVINVTFQQDGTTVASGSLEMLLP